MSINGKRAVIGWALGILFLSLQFQPALASLFLELNVNAGQPGSIVSGVTKGTGAFRVPTPNTLRLFFIPSSMNVAAVDPTSADLVPAGELRVDKSGDGMARIRVPNVSVGRYTVLVLCRECAAFSAGRELLPVADFRVTQSPNRVVDPDANHVSLIAVVIVVAVLGAGLLLFSHARERRSSTEGKTGCGGFARKP